LKNFQLLFLQIYVLQNSSKVYFIDLIRYCVQKSDCKVNGSIEAVDYSSYIQIYIYTYIYYRCELKYINTDVFITEFSHAGASTLE
jgi:hypothetical protein